MLKSRLLVILAFMFILFTGPVRAQNSPIRIACVGNSITQGFGLENPDSDSYPAQLAGILGGNYEVRNFGQAGRTLLKKGDFPYWDTDSLGFKDALGFNPDKVIIMLGSNDTRNPNWSFKEEFIPDYIALIDTFAQLSSKPQIFICQPPPIFQPLFGLNDSLLTNEVLLLIDSVASAKALPLIDVYSLMLPFQQHFFDGVHPDPQGAQMVAANVAAAMLSTKIQNEGIEFSQNPINFELYQNYPNPFNPSTTLTFFVGRASDVSLNIFNLLGERIKTLVDSRQAAGEVQIKWNGTNSAGHPVSSGIYLYRLKIGKEVKTRKMMLTR